MLTIITDEKVPPDEVWLAQPITHSLRQEPAPGGGLILMIVTKHRIIGKITGIG